MRAIGGYFSGEGYRGVLDFHFAREVDFHLDGGDVDAVLIDMSFVVWIHLRLVWVRTEFK